MLIGSKTHDVEKIMHAFLFLRCGYGISADRVEYTQIHLPLVPYRQVHNHHYVDCFSYVWFSIYLNTKSSHHHYWLDRTLAT